MSGRDPAPVSTSPTGRGGCSCVRIAGRVNLRPDPLTGAAATGAAAGGLAFSGKAICECAVGSDAAWVGPSTRRSEGGATLAPPMWVPGSPPHPAVGSRLRRLKRDASAAASRGRTLIRLRAPTRPTPPSTRYVGPVCVCVCVVSLTHSGSYMTHVVDPGNRVLALLVLLRSSLPCPLSLSLSDLPSFLHTSPSSNSVDTKRALGLTAGWTG